MLTPAVHVMHAIWKGMAWVTEDPCTDDEEKGYASSKQVSIDTVLLFGLQKTA